MNEMILKHVRTLPVELVAAELAKSIQKLPGNVSGYTYEDKERGYLVRIEVSIPSEGK